MPIDKTHTNIRRLREEKGLSQTRMAEELGIGRTTYINFETGKVNLYGKTFTKFADYLGTSEEDILASGRDDSLLEERRNYEEKRQALIREYEDRIEALGDKLKAALDLVKAQEQTIRTLSETNSFLLSRLREE